MPRAKIYRKYLERSLWKFRGVYPNSTGIYNTIKCCDIVASSIQMKIKLTEDVKGK